MIDKFKSKNVTAQVVVNRVNEVIKTMNVCKCDKCIKDVYAISLNGVRPHYVNTKKGENFVLEEMFDTGNLSELDKVISKAVDIVTKHPRHE